MDRHADGPTSPCIGEGFQFKINESFVAQGNRNLSSRVLRGARTEQGIHVLRFPLAGADESEIVGAAEYFCTFHQEHDVDRQSACYLPDALERVNPRLELTVRDDSAPTNDDATVRRSFYERGIKWWTGLFLMTGGANIIVGIVEDGFRRARVQPAPDTRISITYIQSRRLL